MLGEILGGSDSSRLYRKFKYDLRLVENIQVDWCPLEHMGMILIDVEMQADKLDEFWPAFLREMVGLRDAKFTSEEIERAKINLVNGIYRRNETLGGMAANLGDSQFFHRTLAADKHAVQGFIPPP